MPNARLPLWFQLLIHYSSSNDFRNLCEVTPCPDASKATYNDCCVHHSNVHSCAPSVSFVLETASVFWGMLWVLKHGVCLHCWNLGRLHNHSILNYVVKSYDGALPTLTFRYHFVDLGSFLMAPCPHTHFPKLDSLMKPGRQKPVLTILEVTF